MPRREMTLLSYGFLLAAVGSGLDAYAVLAADYDEIYQPRAPRVIAGPVVPVLDPRCRIVPMPEHNLFGDTARFRPTLICMSRGLVADSYDPAPLNYPYYNR